MKMPYYSFKIHRFSCILVMLQLVQSFQSCALLSYQCVETCAFYFPLSLSKYTFSCQITDLQVLSQNASKDFVIFVDFWLKGAVRYLKNHLKGISCIPLSWMLNTGSIDIQWSTLPEERPKIMPKITGSKMAKWNYNLLTFQINPWKKVGKL